MDTSETYILMCQKAEEIQKQMPVSPSGYPSPMDWYRYSGNKSIWLPCQDQLQEMSGEKDVLLLLAYFQNWAAWDSENCTSMEQLWLAFVMHEKFEKTWDGSKWLEVTG